MHFKMAMSYEEQPNDLFVVYLTIPFDALVFT